MHSMGSISARRHSITRPASSGFCAPGGRSARSVEMQVAPDDVGQVLEPERRHGGQHPPLVGDRLGHDHVERRDAVRRDQQQPVVAGVVHVTDLARVEMGQIDVDGHRALLVDRQ